MKIDPEVLAHLPDDIEISITMTAKDLRKALTRADGGPAFVSTVWCAEHLGFSTRQWRDWCESGLIDGATKDEGGRWRLPNQAAREHLSRSLFVSELQPSAPRRGRKRRVPWKKAASSRSEP